LTATKDVLLSETLNSRYIVLYIRRD